MERPFKQEELAVLRKGRSPRANESSDTAGWLGCLAFFIVIIAYGWLASLLSMHVSMFWAAVLPFPVIGMVYLLYRFILKEFIPDEFGHAVIETVTATDIQISSNADGYTIKVLHPDGEITWSGEMTVVYFGHNEEGFRKVLRYLKLDAAITATGYQLPLDTLLTMSSDVLWVRFEPAQQSSTYHLGKWGLADYFRTEYDLIRSSKTDALVFVGLDSGTAAYFGNTITFGSNNIQCLPYPI
ncbi:hypothetical protein ACTJJ0_03860 [Chitinophaga sp. 22321]|uniref:DUF4178 domain-containing protein n=1 Tax=Chitinophaga hostae TaxID=2831022 RepID=A0ABS5IXW6_9BACT|nr:hypothetical protein [Chitinophaga hostae]MBS0027776.1 hypothetical protein [Chitinophaga hostae]